MKIVVAPDSFKGSLSAADLCEAMAAGIRQVCPEAEIVKVPMADGGEGTVAALVSATHGRVERVRVTGPLGEPVEAEYGILGDGVTAVIEMASASGLPLVPVHQRNPLNTTTYGTGQLMLAALERGCRKLIIGIGGSATTDGGTGMAQALGVKFYRADGREIQDYMTGGRMGDVARIDLSARSKTIIGCDIAVACDVDNPLLGPHGAVMVYSGQKGANESQRQLLESNMRHLIGIIENTIRRSIRNIPGTGAAGGLGAGLVAFVEAALKPGVQLVLEACAFSAQITGAQLIFTGEGRIDVQTAYGKTISGVIREARRQSIPVIVIAGTVEDEAENLYPDGVTSMFSICPGPMSMKSALHNTGHYVSKCVERVLRAMRAGRDVF
jgi:glycerate kinase